MQVVNIHRRIIKQPKVEVVSLLKTLASQNDKVWPNKKWPRIQFKGGLKVGAKGGHGIIRYKVEQCDFENLIGFKFYKPKGFNGIHKIEIEPIDAFSTEIKHSILMTTEGLATLKWIFVIRWLHDALIENAFDNIENNFSDVKAYTKWSHWVRLWRYILK
mgnify:FL=1